MSEKVYTTWTKDTVIQVLKEDYNSAVKFFNEHDYKTFWGKIRLVLESFGRLTIFELNSKEFAEKIINQSGYNGQGTNLFYYIIDNQNNIERAFKNFFHDFAYFYKIASQYGSHPSHETDTINAHMCACSASLFIALLIRKNIFSKETIDSLNELEKFDIDRQQFIDNEQEKIVGELNKQISALENTLSEKDSTINRNNEQIESLNSRISILQQQLEEINKKSEDPQSDISDDIEKQAEFIHLMSKKLSDVLRPQTGTWMVEEGSLDDDQLDIIERTNDKNMLVTGCAGSGKSVIAMYKAEQLSKAGYSVILIAYTKSLSAFMREGVDVKSLPYSFYYHHQWQKKRPKADYIIVDEIQDFTAEEIKEFMNAAKKHYFFFGDWAQTIYQGLKTTISKEGLCNLTGLKPLELYTNYRLPRNIAKITQEYVGVGVNEYSEKIYKNEEKSLPHIVRFTNKDEQISAIVKIIEENSDKKIGILLPTNPDIKLLSDKLRSLGVKFELKINEKDEEDDESFESLSNLDFNSSLPKLLTYHSAKGLQFDVVILPFCEDANDRMSLYVAMTRTLQSLYVLYSSDLKQPLSNVPESLYLNKL